MKHRKIGIPKTAGDLKIMLELYPDKTPLNFRNQPAQTLYQQVTDDKFILYFQVDEFKKK